MPQYLAPGVYVEEVSSGIRPIVGVSTSIAGFIGEVTAGADMPPIPGEFTEESPPQEVLYTLVPAGEPQLITNWEQFKNKFGNFCTENKTLAHAVYGFFNNGGTRCWIIRVEDIESDTSFQAALAKFKAIDEIALVAAPGVTNIVLQGYIVDHCVNAGDRFAILDGQQTDQFIPGDINGGLADSDYAALYYPWIEVYDPVTKGRDFMPPSGHIAGIYARVDAQRGVHKAPANEVIRGATNVEYRLGRADQMGLNPSGINVIRAFDSNVTVWGARTLGGDANTEWKYINVRRLFLFLRESIDEGSQWVVFEPNTPELWSRITRNITAFLTTVWRGGALFGASPQEAFYVKCDAETNPPEVRDLGQVITEIGVAVVKPAEFVIFRISQWAGAGG
jgi:hypothetical protein